MSYCVGNLISEPCEPRQTIQYTFHFTRGLNKKIKKLPFSHIHTFEMDVDNHLHCAVFSCRGSLPRCQKTIISVAGYSQQHWSFKENPTGCLYSQLNVKSIGRSTSVHPRCLYMDQISSGLCWIKHIFDPCMVGIRNRLHFLLVTSLNLA